MLNEHHMGGMVGDEIVAFTGIWRHLAAQPYTFPPIVIVRRFSQVPNPMPDIHIPPEAVPRRRITQAELKELLNYDQDTGLFTWARSVKNGSIPAGTKAGAINSNGYIRIEIKNRIYMAHRLAWLYVTGAWPDGIIDHIDTCKNNNRFSNLRLATAAENGWNCKAPSTNSTGVKGVRWHKTNKRWCAGLKVNGKDVHVGTFRSLELAISAIRAARAAYHGKFANHAASQIEGPND